MLLSNDLAVNRVVDFVIVVLKSVLLVTKSLVIQLEVLAVYQLEESLPRN